MGNQQETTPNKFISKEELEDLYINKKLSDAEIGKLYNMSVGKIHRIRGKYNIKKIEYYQRHHTQELTDKEKEFIVGTMLGDGHIRWRDQHTKSYPCLMLEQSADKIDYVNWLKLKISNWEFNPNKPLKQTRKINKKTNKISHSYPIQTICHPVFIEFYNAFYNGNININFINKYFTKFSLAVWFMDDGTKSKNKNIIICSHDFTEEENKQLSQMIKNKFNIDSKVLKSNKYYYLSFNKENSIKLTELINDDVIPSMKYKLISPETTKQS